MSFNPKKPIKNILILVDSHQRGDFFERFYKSLTALDIKPIIITALPTIQKKLKSQNISSYLCSNYPIIEHHPIDCLEYETGLIDQELCANIFNSTYRESERIFQKTDIDLCFMWNGSRTQSRALTKACRERGIQTLYFELSNISGKLFIDPHGVNSESFLYKNPTYLKRKTSDTKNYRIWKDNYVREKLKNHIVSQSQQTKKINFRYLLDYILWIFGIGIPLFDLKYIYRSLKRTIKLRDTIEIEHDLPKGQFIFLPLQVSSDSQILFHSEIGNLEALEIASNLSNSENLPLVVKIHPAENSPEFIKNVIKLQKKYKFYISDENTFILIKNSKSVITINSSTGLEAIIMEKEAIFLGKSIYKNINSGNIANYIISHLIDINYFTSTDITEETLINIFERVNIPPPIIN